MHVLQGQSDAAGSLTGVAEISTVLACCSGSRGTLLLCMVSNAGGAGCAEPQIWQIAARTDETANCER